MNEYIEGLVTAGRAAAQDLLMPRHRGAIAIGDGRCVVWSWETQSPHPAELEDALRTEADPVDGCEREVLGGGIEDGLGLWIMSGDADNLDEFVWDVCRQEIEKELAGAK